MMRLPGVARWNDDNTWSGVRSRVGSGESLSGDAAVGDERDSHHIVGRRHRGWSLCPAVPVNGMHGAKINTELSNIQRYKNNTDNYTAPSDSCF